MAVANSGKGERERELLNQTLSSLRSTSKGQLRYNSDWKISEDVSANFPCSLQSFLSESIGLKDLIISLEQEFESETSANDHDTETSVEATTSPDMGKGDAIERIAINFNCQNDLRIMQYREEMRKHGDERKEQRRDMILRRLKSLPKSTEEMKRSNHEFSNDEQRQFDGSVAKREFMKMEELRRRKQALDEKAKEHKQKLDEIYTRALLQESHMAKKEEERRAVLENLKKNIDSLFQQVLANTEAIQQQLSDCKHMSHVEAEVYEDIVTALSGITVRAENIMVKCMIVKELSTAEDFLENMNKLVRSSMSLDHKVISVLEEAKKKAEIALRARQKKEVEEAKQAEEKMYEKREREKLRDALFSNRTDEEGQHTELTLPSASCQAIEPRTSQQSTSRADPQFVKCISENAFAEYKKLQDLLESTHASFTAFTTDPKNTKYKFDLQKAVNVPINALSAHSPSQLNDKIFRLVTLLSGDDVQVGGKQINCKRHPCALAFCKDLVAKKLVMQGAQQVSSNPPSAFIYAAVIVGIWSAFPDIGELILAHFHNSYPYLVPYYMPQREGQTSNDYHKALGYSVINDKIEEENRFLKKFSGTVQLYAAIISSKGAMGSDHPHGIARGWMWLARTLNLEPHPSITATMLLDFIKVAGHMLMECYGKQFQKLLLTLCKDFIPAIDKVTIPEKRGPTQRLKDFLEECIKSQRIALPEGYLNDRWWQTGHF